MNRRVVIVTGTRAEFGLLRSTIASIGRHPDLEAMVVAGGAHLLEPGRTIEEVRAECDVAAEVEMQRNDESGRDADAVALGRGVTGFARAFGRLDPAVVVVLGDRIEALAAASAASIAGRRVVHVHGGDRAEGVADEAMRHAITRLAHLHLAATTQSGERLDRTGEDPASIQVVGSPAVDGLDEMMPAEDSIFESMGTPRTILLQHGAGLDDSVEAAWIDAALTACVAHGPTLVLRPNADPGSSKVIEGIDAFESAGLPGLVRRDHLPRPDFIGCLRRVDAIVGNSSAGLIEASIVGCPAVNLGPRQAGRERPGSVIDIGTPSAELIRAAIEEAARRPRRPDHPYGGPGVGDRIASAIATMLDHASGPPRKRLVY